MSVELKSALEVFILALIERGVSTPYALKSTADISPGASIPALRRLKAARLVTSAARESRRKQAYQLTAAGRRTLRASISALISEYQQKPPWDLESVLRVATLALLRRRPKEAARVLEAASIAWASPRKPRGGVPAPEGPAIYRELLEECEVASLVALSSRLKAIAARYHRPRKPRQGV